MTDQLDISELTFGFAIGKAHNLSEWKHRKEKQEFARICNILGCIKRRNEYRQAADERWEQFCETRRKIDHNPERRKKHNARRNAKRKKAYQDDPIATCVVCGATWIRPFVKGHVKKCCSDACKLEYTRIKDRRNRKRRAEARKVNEG